MKYTLEKRKYGIGLAAPQIGKGIGLIVVGLKATPTRPNIEKLDMILINPKITKFYGAKAGMWEACISGSELYLSLIHISVDGGTYDREQTSPWANVIQITVYFLYKFREGVG